MPRPARRTAPIILWLAVALLGAARAFADDAAAERVQAEDSAAVDGSSEAGSESGSAATESVGPGQAEEPDPDDLFLKTVALDIASSDYYALVAWAESLGLPKSGGVEELRARLYERFKAQPPAAAAASKRTITIVSADKTEYLSAKEGSESTVRFTGRVSLKVNDDEAGESLTVTADEVTVNRDADILSARGDVVFERKKASGTDYFLGDMIQLDMNDWSGVFLDGRSQRDSGSSESGALRFQADDIIKRGSDVLTFKDGVISSCDDDDPHYSIRASKIWILGGNEWAMLNATLSVGELPLLYLPFFYYPGEEIVFHPVFGYDPRFGRYVQTTTYLVGEKEPREQEISLLNITEGGGGYERKVEGVFLRTTREKKKGSTTDFVKVIADLYSSLGGFAAADAKLASLGPFKGVEGFAGVGISRSLFLGSDGVTYSPFVAATGFDSVWNEVDLYGLTLPFRFGLNLSGSIEAGPARVSVSLPFYTDSFWNRDFKDRSENMNWLQFLDQETDETTIAKISSFTDAISLSASVPSSKLPTWLSKVSLTKLATSLAWNSDAKDSPTDADELARFNVDPAREYFLPYEWSILDAQASLSGTLFSWPAKSSAKASSKGSAKDSAADKPSVAEAAQGSKDAAEAAIGGDEGDDEAGEEESIARFGPAPEPEAPWEKSGPVDEAGSDTVASGESWFSPPPLATPEAYTDRDPLSTSMSWSYTPTFAWKRRFLSAAWSEPDEVDWAALYETRTLRNSASLSWKADLYEQLLKVEAGLSASSQYQDRPIASDDAQYASDSVKATWAKQDAQYRADKVSATLSATSSPFQDIWLWSPTSLSYTLSSLLYQYAFESIDSELVPSYKTTWADWTDDTVTSHKVSAVLGAKPWGYTQSLTLAADLPPILEGYSAALGLASRWGKLTLSSAYTMPEEDAEFEWDPLNASLTLGATPWPVVTGSFIYDIESGLPTTVSGGVSWGGFSASVSAKEAVAYSLELGSGWLPTGDAEFRPEAASFSFKKAWAPPPAWKNRISWTLNLDLNARQSFLKFSDSYMSVVAGFTLKVHEFLDITFSSTSRNSSLWRYYPGFFDIPESFGVEPVDPVSDILSSLNFFDSTGASRRSALFKLKSLSITATHLMHDWDLSLKYTASPELNESSLEYEFKTSFSISLAWRSVSQIKAKYEKTGDTTTWD